MRLLILTASSTTPSTSATSTARHSNMRMISMGPKLSMPHPSPRTPPGVAQSPSDAHAGHLTGTKGVWNMTDWPSVLGGATFAGIFGFIVAWYTNKQADERADTDRAERAQIRAEDRAQQNNRRIHEQGMDAVHRFLTAVSRLQTVSYYYKSSPEQVTSTVSEMEAARWGVAAYFPGPLYEMTDMTRIAALAFMRTVANGDKAKESESSETLRGSLHELMWAVHIELGHDFALAEQKRAKEKGEPLQGRN